jgi:hypothetical protein
MAEDKESRRLQLEEDIVRLSRSTRTSWGWAIKLHDMMRMKFRWYYLWHANPASERVHIAGAVAIGAVFALFALIALGGMSVIGVVRWFGMMMR